MSAPLMSGEALIGVLSLYSADHHAFTEDHGRLVQMIAPHVALAISRAQRTMEVAPAGELPHAPLTRDLRLVASR